MRLDELVHLSGHRTVGTHDRLRRARDDGDDNVVAVGFEVIGHAERLEQAVHPAVFGVG